MKKDHRDCEKFEQVLRDLLPLLTAGSCERCWEAVDRIRAVLPKRWSENFLEDFPLEAGKANGENEK